MCDKAALVAPVQCAENMYQPSEGASSYSACQPCPLEWTAAPGAAVCTAPSSDDATLWLTVFFAVVGTLVVLAVVYFRVKRHNVNAQYLMLLAPVVSSFDLCSDMLVLRDMARSDAGWDGWAYASLVSLGLATSLCLVTVVAVLYREMKHNPAFRQWLGAHKLYASLLAVLASTNTEVLTYRPTHARAPACTHTCKTLYTYTHAYRCSRCLRAK